MLIYFLTIFLIGGLYFLIYHSTTDRKRFVQLSFILLFLISSLRDKSIGADYIQYVGAFNTIRVTGRYYMESGYVLLNTIVSQITDNYIGMAIAVNLMLFIPLYRFIIRNISEKYWGLTVFVFAANPYLYIQSTFNAMRQCCATGLILLGLDFLLHINKRYVSYFVFFISVVLAAQIHKVAYIFALVPIIYLVRWTKKKWFITLLIILFARLIGISGIVAIIGRMMRYTTYINYKPSLLNQPIYVIFLVIISLFFIYHYDDFIEVTPLSKKHLDIYLFSFMFLILALSNDMLYRIYIILAFCSLPGIAVVCEGINFTQTRVRIKGQEKIIPRMYFFYYLFFYIGYIALLAYNQNANYIPFRFCF